MSKTLIIGMAAAVAVIVFPAAAQQNQRRASLTGGGNPNEGNCAVEVVVDGTAELEIRGDSGVLQSVSGRRPEWRRFECTGRMPDTAVDLRVRGMERGSV